MGPSGASEAPFRAHLAGFAYTGREVRPTKRSHAPVHAPMVHERAPLAPRNLASPPRPSATLPITTPMAAASPAPACVALEAIPRACIRMLPRCSLCASHFPASHTAPKRRAHLAACAAARQCSDAELVAAVDAHVVAELQAARARDAAAQSARTLFATLALPTSPLTPRWARLASQRPRPLPAPLQRASEGHRAAHAMLSVLLPRLATARTDTPTRYPQRHAPLYDAAYRSEGRVLRTLLHALEPRRRARGSRAARAPRTYVATSDAEEAADATCYGIPRDANEEATLVRS